MEARERFAELVRESGASLAALSRKIGRNPSYLHQYVTKGSPRRLEERDRRVLAGIFGVPESALGGPKENNVAEEEWFQVPRFQLEASAGFGALGGEEEPFDVMRFSRKWLREQGLQPEMLSAIRVVGDSMDPLLRDGDEILVDQRPNPFRDGIHVLRVGDFLQVKRVQAAAPGKLMLISANPAYEPVEVSLTDVNMIGRVVWKGGRV
ncbi:S24 family peptidase [Altericroceibacterium xinjiangense]|uniref:S24 family peptidase n=1 Tax=Altericroceibacterium xinjiangense TaxID=762261 RepID=UPI000F7E014E|nr:LexA family transcriptional regulator [Altericroceibacterium xinjiangense]